MTETEYQIAVQRTHDAYCKIVIRRAAITAIRRLQRKWEREISLEYLMYEKYFPITDWYDFVRAAYQYAHPNVIASNVFCAWNHPIGMDFGDIFKSEDSMLQARELIVRYFEQINCKNPSGHASVQYQDWKLFKAFCDAQGIHE